MYFVRTFRCLRWLDDNEEGWKHGWVGGCRVCVCGEGVLPAAVRFNIVGIFSCHHVGNSAGLLRHVRSSNLCWQPARRGGAGVRSTVYIGRQG